MEARRRGRSLPGRHRLGSPPRRAQARSPAKTVDPRHGRRWAASTRATTNAYACNGDGMAMALHAGRPAQGHGVHAVPSRRRSSRAASSSRRAAAARAAYLLNRDGERFMARYAPNAIELASRDVISRPETTEIEEGRGSTATSSSTSAISAPSASSRGCTGSRELSMTFAGVDPIYEPIPVRPGAHYHMGGVATDNWGATELDGLYAAGEVACVSVHGANRLGGNSLMETITFGKRVGQARGRAGAREHRPSSVPASRRGRRRARPRDAPRPQGRREAVEDPRRARRLDARELRGLSLCGADVRAARHRPGAPRALRATSSSRTRATSSTPISRRRSSSATCSTSRGSWCRPDSRARRAAALTARPADFPERDDERFLRTPSVTRWDDGAPELDWKPVTHDEVPARGAQLLMKVALKIWRYDAVAGERALREYEIDAPEEATLLDCPRHRQGPATTARSRIARAAG